MGVFAGPEIVEDGLVLTLDAGNTKSYPGSGTTWTNLSGNGNNGTLVNGVGYDSASGGSLTFDGTNDYVSIPNMSTYLTNKTQFSYSTFIKITGAGTFGMFFTFGNSNNFANDITFYYKPADTTLNFQVNNGSDGRGLVSYTAGQYDNICVVYDGNQSTNATRLKVYINGNLQTLTFIDYNVPASTSSTSFTDCVIGIYSTANYASTTLFSGNVGTSQLYNKALAAAEVKQNFNALRGRFGI